MHADSSGAVKPAESAAATSESAALCTSAKLLDAFEQVHEQVYQSRPAQR